MYEVIRFIIIVAVLGSHTVLLAMLYNKFGKAQELLEITKRTQELQSVQTRKAASLTESLPEKAKQAVREAIKEVNLAESGSQIHTM